MNVQLETIVFEKQNNTAERFDRIGGGFYADVYKFDYKNSDPVVVKVYKSKGLMEKEISQIQILSKYALFPMPQVIWTHNADDVFAYDILAMNCLSGENGGSVFYLNPSKRAKLAEQVVDNLIAFHNEHNPNGFGEINSDKYYKTFNEYYIKRTVDIFNMAKKLNENGQISDYVLAVVSTAVKNFDKIFYLPITESSLIHGDYNMWNIMIDKKNCKVTAVIDPCGCMWADREFDLYQLNNANGKHLKLFETYAKKKSLSENYRQKMAFYHLFTEIEHYYNSGYPVKQEQVKKQADRLKSFLKAQA
ncbi:MAG: phosphotransferase [Oscillospiraceae bacterium]|nr:phosphotransferase [Oscillospiraceae bacterium]